MRGDMVAVLVSVFFFNDTATTEIYTLSLHDALPISPRPRRRPPPPLAPSPPAATPRRDRKSTRLNSSHEWISYAVFCLKKKNVLSQADDRGAFRRHPGAGRLVHGRLAPAHQRSRRVPGRCGGRGGRRRRRPGMTSDPSWFILM